MKTRIPSNTKMPFKVPDGYFENFTDRMMSRLRNEDVKLYGKSRKIYLRPYLSLAASVSGLALIVYIVLQIVAGAHSDTDSFYNLSLLDNEGITSDESVLAEAYFNEMENAYTEWEKEAMTYLASNEVDLLNLLESN